MYDLWIFSLILLVCRIFNFQEIFCSVTIRFYGLLFLFYGCSSLSSLWRSKSRSVFFLMFIYYLFIIIFNIYLFLKEIGRAQAGERQRGSEAGSVLTAESPCGAQTHEPRDHDPTWSRMLNWQSHPGAPKCLFLRERGRAWAGEGRERWVQRIWSRIWADRQLTADSRAWGSHKLWDHDLSRCGMLNRATQAPVFVLFLKIFSICLVFFQGPFSLFVLFSILHLRGLP